MQVSMFESKLRRITTLLSIAILTFTAVAAVTGVLLSFYYEPAAGRAYRSLEYISSAVSYGWLIRKAHDVAGNGLITIGLIQIVVMFISRQFRSSWLIAWIGGIFLTLSAIGLGWTAMILNWDQEGYWRFNIELGTISSIPFVGGLLRTILTGGDGINTVTVQHLYALHSYVLSIVVLVFAVVHLIGVWQQEQQMRGNLAETVSAIEADGTEKMGDLNTNPQS